MALVPRPFQASRLDAETPSVDPGTWWRLVDPDHPIARLDLEPGTALPEHGLVLLVSEIHVVDGDLHSVSLHGHPLLRMGRTRLLREAFLAAFAPCPEGEALRARELAAAMGRIQSIGASMSEMPSDDALLAVRPAIEAGPAPAPDASPARAARVPAALLPSGDVTAVQARIERNIAALEARSAWVAARTEDMRQAAKIVQAYQEEKVAQTLAGISEQRKMAESLLANVHTMRLFLGEDVQLKRLVDGEGAPPDEPLHLMQRMLFLDEEIFVSSVMDDGFHAGHMKDLPGILADNPGLVRRMLPHPRSVAIARIRRRSRAFETPRDFAEVFRMVEDDAQDKRVRILIRDGDSVLMAIADEETSGAQRLFPSRAEIDAIFTGRDGYDPKAREYRKREITPFDIEYSDKRSEHDRRALFYKRFLIILWGLHERDGAFGAFVPPGTNWLEETVHRRHFRFVHDEENALSDDLPPVRDWIAEMNAWIRPGSRILVRGDAAMSEDTAPTAFRETRTSRGSAMVRVRDSVHRLEEITAVRRGGEIVAPLETETSMSSGRRHVKTPLTIRRVDGRVETRGLLCLDRVDSRTLRRFIDSRRDRESYLDWLELFMGAVKIVEAREAEDRADLDRLSAARPDLAGALPEALRMVREDRKWARPEGEDERILDLAVRLSRLRGRLPEDIGLQVRLRANGDVVRIRAPADPRAAAARAPLLDAETLKFGRDGEVRATGTRRISFHHLPDIGETVVAGRLGEADTRTAWLASIRGLRDVVSFERLAETSSTERAAEIAAFLERARSASPSEAAEMLEEVRRLNHASRRPHVEIPRLSKLAGVAVMENRDGGAQAFAVRVAIDPVKLAFGAGGEDLVARMCHRLYARPKEAFEVLRGSCEGRPALAVEVRPLRDDAPLSAAQVFDDGWSFDDWEPLSGQSIRVELDWRVQGPVREIEMPADFRHALAVRRHGRTLRAEREVETILRAAETARLIAGPGIEARLDAIVEATRRARPRSTAPSPPADGPDPSP